MLWFFAILVLKALATLRRVICRILSWKWEFRSVLALSPPKSNLSSFGGPVVFCLESKWSVCSRYFIILLASNITLSFSGTKSKVIKIKRVFKFGVCAAADRPCYLCVTSPNYSPNCSNSELYWTNIWFVYLLHASWRRQTISFVSCFVDVLAMD